MPHDELLAEAPLRWARQTMRTPQAGAVLVSLFWHDTLQGAWTARPGECLDAAPKVHPALSWEGSIPVVTVHRGVPLLLADHRRVRLLRSTRLSLVPGEAALAVQGPLTWVFVETRAPARVGTVAPVDLTFLKWLAVCALAFAALVAASALTPTEVREDVLAASRARVTPAARRPGAAPAPAWAGSTPGSPPPPRSR